MSPQAVLARARRLPAPLRDAGLYALALGWTKALTMVTLPVLTACLAPADFARIELLSSAAEIAALFLCGGLVDTAYRFAAAPGEAGRRAAADILGLAVVLSAAGLAVALVASPSVARHLPLPGPARDPMLLGIAVSCEALIAVPMGMLRMSGRAGTYAAAAMARTTLQALLAVVLLRAGFGVSGVMGAGAVAAVLAALTLTGRQARHAGIGVRPAAWGRLLGYGVPLIGSGLASFLLGTADRWLLAGRVPAAELGQYALAAKIALIAALLTQPFELWWYPRRLAVLAGPDGAARSVRIVAIGAGLAVAAAGATALGGPLVIRLLTPPAYHQAAAYVPWLASAIGLQALGSLVNVGCYARRTGMAPLAVNGVAALSAVTLYALLIPAHGVSGAVAATVVAQAVRLAGFFALSQYLHPLPWHRLGLQVA